MYNNQIMASDMRGISDASIGQLKLLLELSHETEIFHLAYIQHFIRQDKRDEETDM